MFRNHVPLEFWTRAAPVHGQPHFYRYSCGGSGHCSGARAALRTMDMHDLGVFGSSDSDSSHDGDRRRSRAAAAEKDEAGYYSSSDESHDARSTRSAAADASDTAADEGCAASREDVDAVPAAPAGDDDVVPASDDARSSTRAEENS